MAVLCRHRGWFVLVFGVLFLCPEAAWAQELSALGGPSMLLFDALFEWVGFEPQLGYLLGALARSLFAIGVILIGYAYWSAQSRPGSFLFRNRGFAAFERWAPWALCGLVAFVICEPAFAQELKPMTDVTEKILGVLQGKLALGLAAIAVILTGYTYWMGRLSAEGALSVVIGIAIVFGAKPIVNLLAKAAGSTATLN